MRHQLVEGMVTDCLPAVCQANVREMGEVGFSFSFKRTCKDAHRTKYASCVLNYGVTQQLTSMLVYSHSSITLGLELSCYQTRWPVAEVFRLNSQIFCK